MAALDRDRKLGVRQYRKASDRAPGLADSSGHKGKSLQEVGEVERRDHEVLLYNHVFQCSEGYNCKDTDKMYFRLDGLVNMHIGHHMDKGGFWAVTDQKVWYLGEARITLGT